MSEDKPLANGTVHTEDGDFVSRDQIIQGDAIPQILIPQIVDLYLQGRFPIDRLIEYYPLEQINEAVTASEQGAVIKAVLRPNRT